MLRGCFRMLARWPRVSRILLVASGVTAALLLVAWIRIYAGFPPAPPGETGFYARQALEQLLQTLGLAHSTPISSSAAATGIDRWLTLTWLAAAAAVVVRVLAARVAMAMIRGRVHDQVVGAGRVASRLARLREQEGGEAVVYDQVDRPRFVDRILELPRRDRRRVAREAVVLAVDDDDIVNLRLLGELDAGEQAIIRIEHPQLRLDASRYDADRAGLHRFFSVHELSARLVTRKHPLVASVHPKGLTEVVCGSGAAAQAVLANGLRTHHPAIAVPPDRLLLGPQANDLRERILNGSPGVSDWARLRTARLSYADRAGLLERLLACHGALRIHVCEEGAEVVLTLVDALIGMQRELAGRIERIVVHATDCKDDLRSLLRRRAEDWSALVLTDIDCSIEDGELSTQNQLDRMARVLHDAYLAQARGNEGFGDKPSHQPWERLPESFRDENRYLADHLFVKVRELGLLALPAGDASNDGTAKVDWSRMPDDLLEAMAQAEHARWSSSRLLRGWVHSEVRDDARLEHPDLVPWEQLSESVRDYDRRMIQALSEAFEDAGLVLVSIRPAAEAMLRALSNGEDPPAAAQRWIDLRLAGDPDRTLDSMAMTLLAADRPGAIELLEHLLDRWPELRHA